MDIEILLRSIMTDAKGSKSNIAARFKNAICHNVLPPIGVFWDIENCQVPKGKSAIALVQNIREKFFIKHREAEFMCVCDINKESKFVIQELLYAQVTVVHISATSKNAADDKLKQCMKRYVDTHGSPSTLLLISDDVNFASDLSDFRHRHNIRIILVHRGHAHQSLLACAHEHHNFSSIAQDLPIRSPIKSSVSRPTDLEVSELPVNRKEAQIRNKLRKLSNNCGGKVIFVKGSKAVIRFANADAAEKAKKRMDKEIVFGHKISVNFIQKADAYWSESLSRDQFKYSTEEPSTSTSSCSSRDSSLSPPEDRICQPECTFNYSSQNKFNFPPPPVISEQNYPMLLRQKELSKNNMDSSKFLSRSGILEFSKEQKISDWYNERNFPASNNKHVDISAFSPFKKELEHGLRTKYTPRNVGRVSPFFMQDCELKTPKTGFSGPLNEGAISRYDNYSADVVSNNYSSFSSSTFHNFPPFNDCQRIGDSLRNGQSYFPVEYSFLKTSDNASFVELQVSNLDPTFEVNEMKKILLTVFSEHVMGCKWTNLLLEQFGSKKNSGLEQFGSKKSSVLEQFGSKKNSVLEH